MVRFFLYVILSVNHKGEWFPEKQPVTEFQTLEACERSRKEEELRLLAKTRVRPSSTLKIEFTCEKVEVP
jgi:hypothetical protein